MSQCSNITEIRFEFFFVANRDRVVFKIFNEYIHYSDKNRYCANIICTLACVMCIDKTFFTICTLACVISRMCKVATFWMSHMCEVVHVY